MSAFCAFELIYKENEEDFKPLWKVLHQIEGEDETASDDILPMFQKEGNVITTTNSECYNIWGDDAWKPTADVYLLMAKAAPNVEFETSSSRQYEGGGLGAYSRDKSTYKNGRLYLSKWA